MKVYLIRQLCLYCLLHVVKVVIAVLIRERIGESYVHELGLLISSKIEIESDLASFRRTLYYVMILL